MRLGQRRLASVRLGYPDRIAVFSDESRYGSRVPFYRMEVRNPSGTLLAVVNDWHEADIEERVNEPVELSLSVWYQSPAREHLTFPNQVWLYRSDAVTPTHKTIIYHTVDKSTEGEIRTVTAWGIQRKLADEVIETYTTGEAGATIQQIVRDLLGYQLLTPTVSLGTLSTAIGSAVRVVDVDNKTIAQVLDELRDTIGGFIYIDAANRLQWRTAIGNNLGHTIRIGRNATSITRTVDYSEIKTRIIAYGAGVTADTRLAVTVNDSSAQSTYGVRVGTFTNQSITDADTLEAAATAVLRRSVVPQTRYAVDMIDLSRTDLYDLSFEAFALDLGSCVNLIASAISMDIWTRVVSVRRDLADPLDVQITVSDPEAGGGVQGPDAGGVNDPTTAEPDTLESIIESIERRLQRLERDTGVARSINDLIGSVDLSDVGHWDTATNVGNLPELLEDIFEASPVPTDVQNMKDAIEAWMQEQDTSLTWAYVVEIFDDYLGVCGWNPVTQTPDLDGETITGYVAKPYYLQRDPWDGETVEYQNAQSIQYAYSNGYTRTATDTGTAEVETQIVTPNWFVGDVIRVTRGSTNVVVSSNRLKFMDINHHARVWAAEPAE